MCVKHSNFHQIQAFYGVSERARFRGFRDNYFVSKHWKLQFLFAFECRIGDCTFRPSAALRTHMCSFSRTDLFFGLWANMNIPLEAHCNSAHHYTPFHVSQTKTWKILYWFFFFRAVSVGLRHHIFILSVTLSYFFGLWVNVNIPSALHCNSAHDSTPFRRDQTKTENLIWDPMDSGPREGWQCWQWWRAGLRPHTVPLCWRLPIVI